MEAALKSHVSNWIPITAAVELLAERFYDQVAPNWGVAYHSAWSVIRSSLSEGELPSRPGKGSVFEWTLTDTSGREVRSLPIDEVAIPKDFWFHYNEAARIHSDGLITILEGAGAHGAGDDLWFEQTLGIVDGLTMRGQVEQVHIHEPSLPKGARPKRKRGQRGRQYSDEEIVKRAVAAIESGTMTPTQVVKRFSAEMDGENTPVESKAKRLRRRLDELGHWAKK